MDILSSVANRIKIKRLHQIDLFRKFPMQVQEETLEKLVVKAKRTHFGEKYSFGTINSIEKFQERIPIMEYKDLVPYVDMLRRGKSRVLWPSKIKWFAKSSGTTGNKSKFIPVSNEALEDCHFRGGKDVLMLYVDNRPDTRIFSGKGLTLGGSHQIDTYSSELYHGDLSAILIENIPWYADLIRTPSQKVALISDWDLKLEKLIKETIEENVTNFAGVPSWNLVMIKHILEYTGKSNLLEVWPNLELFMHGGVSFTPYREQFKKVIPSDSMNYMETYNASEGFFAIQDDLSRNDMLLMLDYGVFYEFIPMSEFDSPNPGVVTLADVELGKNYAIVITTNSGLWRYLIGDTVVFTSKNPYRIKISGRTKHYINAFGEELIIDNAANALKVACDQTGAQIADYTAAPVYMNDDVSGAHEWLIEFTVEPKSLDEFRDALDRALCAENSDYEAKRYKGITLAEPIVRALPPNTFFEWMRTKGKLGGQNKVPRLSNTREYVDSILEILT